MNFKGNSFSLGAGEYISSRVKDGECDVLIKNNGVTARRTFNPATRTVSAPERAFSYADGCWLIDGGVLELNAGRLSYEKR